MSDFTKTRDEVLKSYSTNIETGLSEQQAKENIEKSIWEYNEKYV